jgi:beta-glucanase (GH16 family)
MRNTHRIALAVALACGTTAQAQWALHWADEFDGTALAGHWAPMIGNGSAYGLPSGWGNNERQYYTDRPSNVTVSNGTLKITARRENFGGQAYTSARLRTMDNFEFKWGRIEARMKLPSTSGVWPALWMLPTGSPYGGWASSGEIDLMESVNNADRIYGTLHHGAGWPNNAHTGNSVVTGTDYSQDFHDYVVEWDPNQIRWYLDGALYGTINSSQWYSSAAPNNPRAPFDSPFHLLVNVAVGGNFPGDPDGSAQYPQTFEVDYIRVYRREQRAYQGGVHPIPGQIEAEHYDEGYPGEAYHDNDIGNSGGTLRDDDVDIQACSEGGHNLGWINTGEWLEYTVDVQTAGAYTLEARVASPNNGGAFRIEVDGQDRTGPIAVQSTGGWQTWQTVEGQIQLDAGPQTLRFHVAASNAGFNFNWLRFTREGGCSAADLAEPYDTLNFFDLAAYMGLFGDQDPSADLAAPFGEFNFFDLAAFLGVFNAGCP